ncbi:MAG TPA: hypothetical protein VJG64_00440 [Candidatus Paceibacterota bacterium]
MNLSDRKLRRSAEHVCYEISMLHFTTQYMSEIPSHALSVNRYLPNALLESWCVHLRNLLDFFYTQAAERYNDDMVAEDYVSDLRQFKRQRAKVKLPALKKRIAKQIAHLTYHRNVYNKKTKPWHYRDIYGKLKPTISAFYDALPDHRKKWPHFVQLKRMIDA